MQQLSHRGVEAELGRYGIGTQRSAVTRRSKCHAQCAPESALLPRSGRRWREAPDEGASAASLLLGFGVDQKHASLRSHPLICPSGVFSRKRERSEEHTSELQSLMRISYAVFCLKKKKDTKSNID